MITFAFGAFFSSLTSQSTLASYFFRRTDLVARVSNDALSTLITYIKPC